MNFRRKITSLVITGIFIAGTTLTAQTVPQSMQQQTQQQSDDVSDKEIRQFAFSFQGIQQINQQSQQKMVNTVENEGLEVQRFNEINQAENNPDQPGNASDKEMEKYNSCIQQIQVIQNNAQEQMQKKITNEGLSVERYQEIMQLVQKDSKLQMRLQQEIENE
jgi:hypothetical protein